MANITNRARRASDDAPDRGANELLGAARFRLTFGRSGDLYRESTQALESAWKEVEATETAHAALCSWRRSLELTHGLCTRTPTDPTSARTTQLYIRHTYLAVLARLYARVGLASGEAPRDLVSAVRASVTGAFFRDRRITNLVEPDFFPWARSPRVLARLMPVWESVLGQLFDMSLHEQDEDVFEGVYQDLVDAEDRHDLGEHYTPRWLCEHLVAEVLPERGVPSVLDPTCGSGSFLRAAITRVIARNPDTDRSQLLEAMLHNIVGIDIHPLAVAIARATYAVQLRDLIGAARGPIVVPVHRADALGTLDSVAVTDARGDVGAAGRCGLVDLRNRFDVVLGNPPWLSYRYIADMKYQAAIKKRAIDDYAIAPRDMKLLTQMELATIFLAHSLVEYGKPGARLAFVMPRSVLSADQHRDFRLQAHRVPMRITSYWDLLDVRPLFRVPACVLFAERFENGAPRPGWSVPVQEWSGCLPGRELNWGQARPSLRIVAKQGGLITLGPCAVFTTAAWGLDLGKSSRDMGTCYQDAFRQGATIVPRSFYFVTVNDRDPSRKTCSIVTDPDQARAAKPPYRDVALAGQVEDGFLFRAVIAKHVLPFWVSSPADVVLPVRVMGARASVLTARELHDRGFPLMGTWMGRAETILNELLGDKAARQPAHARLDFKKGVTNQPLDVRYVVLYNAAGTNLSAAVFDRESLDAHLIVDAKLYYFATASPGEADYLAAILNASLVNTLIKPFQTIGLQGERDIHKRPLDLPIPRFDPGNWAHARIAALGASARQQLRHDHHVGQVPDGKSLARQRQIARGRVRAELDEIDALIRTLWAV